MKPTSKTDAAARASKKAQPSKPYQPGEHNKTIFETLDAHAGYLLTEYVKSRRVDPLDALNGAVEMAFSDGGLTDREAVEEARKRRLATGDATTHPGTHTIVLHLTPVAHAALVILTDYERHPSMEDAVLSTVVASVRSLFDQVLGSDSDSTLADAFGLGSNDGVEDKE